MNVLFHPDAELELNAAIENGLGYDFLLEIISANCSGSKKTLVKVGYHFKTGQ